MLTTPYFGPQQNVTFLKQKVFTLRKGFRGGVAIIEGSEGSGKSRLMEELSEILHHPDVDIPEKPCTPAIGSCEEIFASTPYYGMRGVFNSLVVHAGFDPESQESVATWIQESHPNLASRAHVLACVFPCLSVSQTRVASVYQADPDDILAMHTADVFAELLVAEARKNPLVVLIDDVQWMDSTSWQLIARVASSVHSVLFVLTRCPLPQNVERDYTALLEDVTCDILRVKPLSSHDMRTFAMLTLHVDLLPQWVALVLENRSQNFPGFVKLCCLTLLRLQLLDIQQWDEEMFRVRALWREENGYSHTADRSFGALAVDGPRFGVEKLPEDMNGVIAALVGTLSKHDRAVLLIMSVIGMLCTRDAVYFVATSVEAIRDVLLSPDESSGTEGLAASVTPCSSVPSTASPGEDPTTTRVRNEVDISLQNLLETGLIAGTTVHGVDTNVSFDMGRVATPGGIPKENIPVSLAFTYRIVQRVVSRLHEDSLISALHHACAMFYEKRSKQLLQTQEEQRLALQKYRMQQQAQKIVLEKSRTSSPGSPGACATSEDLPLQIPLAVKPTMTSNLSQGARANGSHLRFDSWVLTSRMVHHWRLADQPVTCLGYLLTCAAQTCACGARVEAIMLYSEAVQIVDDHDLDCTPLSVSVLQGHIYRRIGDCLYGIGESDQAAESLRLALKCLGEPPTEFARELGVWTKKIVRRQKIIGLASKLHFPIPKKLERHCLGRRGFSEKHHAEEVAAAAQKKPLFSRHTPSSPQNHPLSASAKDVLEMQANRGTQGPLSSTEMGNTPPIASQARCSADDGEEGGPARKVDETAAPEPTTSATSATATPRISSRRSSVHLRRRASVTGGGERRGSVAWERRASYMGDRGEIQFEMWGEGERLVEAARCYRQLGLIFWHEKDAPLYCDFRVIDLSSQALGIADGGAGISLLPEAVSITVSSELAAGHSRTAEVLSKHLSPELRQAAKVHAYATMELTETVVQSQRNAPRGSVCSVASLASLPRGGVSMSGVPAVANVSFGRITDDERPDMIVTNEDAKVSSGVTMVHCGHVWLGCGELLAAEECYTRASMLLRKAHHWVYWRKALCGRSCALAFSGMFTPALKLAVTSLESAIVQKDCEGELVAMCCVLQCMLPMNLIFGDYVQLVRPFLFPPPVYRKGVYNKVEKKKAGPPGMDPGAQDAPDKNTKRLSHFFTESTPEDVVVWALSLSALLLVRRGDRPGSIAASSNALAVLHEEMTGPEVALRDGKPADDENDAQDATLPSGFPLRININVPIYLPHSIFRRRKINLSGDRSSAMSMLGRSFLVDALLELFPPERRTWKSSLRWLRKRVRARAKKKEEEKKKKEEDKKKRGSVKGSGFMWNLAQKRRERLGRFRSENVVKAILPSWLVDDMADFWKVATNSDNPRYGEEIVLEGLHALDSYTRVYSVGRLRYILARETLEWMMHGVRSLSEARRVVESARQHRQLWEEASALYNVAHCHIPVTKETPNPCLPIRRHLRSLFKKSRAKDPGSDSDSSDSDSDDYCSEDGGSRFSFSRAASSRRGTAKGGYRGVHSRDTQRSRDPQASEAQQRTVYLHHHKVTRVTVPPDARRCHNLRDCGVPSVHAVRVMQWRQAHLRRAVRLLTWTGELALLHKCTAALVAIEGLDTYNAPTRLSSQCNHSAIASLPDATPSPFSGLNPYRVAQKEQFAIHTVDSFQKYYPQYTADNNHPPPPIKREDFAALVSRLLGQRRELEAQQKKSAGGKRTTATPTADRPETALSRKGHPSQRRLSVSMDWGGATGASTSRVKILVKPRNDSRIDDIKASGMTPDGTGSDGEEDEPLLPSLLQPGEELPASVLSPRTESPAMPSESILAASMARNSTRPTRISDDSALPSSSVVSRTHRSRTHLSHGPVHPRVPAHHPTPPSSDRGNRHQHLASRGSRTTRKVYSSLLDNDSALSGDVVPLGLETGSKAVLMRKSGVRLRDSNERPVST
eukprot:Rmarinus@m.14461